MGNSDKQKRINRIGEDYISMLAHRKKKKNENCKIKWAFNIQAYRY